MPLSPNGVNVSIPQWRYTELRAEWLLIAHVNDVTDANTINAETYVSPALDISWDQIRQILMGEVVGSTWDWGTLSQTASIPIGGTLIGGGTQTATIQGDAIAIQQCAVNGRILKSSDINVWNKIVAAGTLLSGSTVKAIAAATATAVSNLRTPTLSLWGTGVSQFDILAARTSAFAPGA